MNYIFLLCFWFVGCLCALAQDHFSFAAFYDDTHGISRRPVTTTAIAVDQALWLGTADGVFVYESSRFLPAAARLAPGSPIPKGMILSMAYDSLVDCIWIATDGNGLHKLNVCTRMIESFSTVPDADNPGAVITAVCPTDTGLWVGTRTNGLFFLNYENQQFYQYPNFPTSIPIAALLSWHEHQLIIGTPGHGLYMALESGDIQKITSCHDFIVSIIPLDTHQIIIGGEQSICTLNLMTGTYKQHNANPCAEGNLRALLRMPDGRLLAQTSCGLYALHSSGQWSPSIHPAGRQTGGGYCLLLDANANVWAGFESGLGVLHTGIDRNMPDPIGTGFTVDVFSIFEDRKGTIYIGAAGSGVWKQEYPNCWIPLIPQADVLNITEFNGDIWAATYGQGILKVRGDKVVKQAAPDFVYSLVAQDAQTLWAGTEQQGIWYYQQGKWKAITSSQGLSCATLILQDTSVYFAGFEKGLGVLDQASQKIVLYRPPHTETWVQAIFYTDTGFLWVAMYGEGLWQFDIKNKSWCMPNSNRVLMQSVVSGVAKHPLGWWITTHEGLWCLHRSGELVRWRLHNSQPFPEFNTASLQVLSNGEIWAGGPKGIWKLPEPIEKKNHANHSVIFRIFNSGSAAPVGSLCKEGAITSASDFPLLLHWSAPIQATDIQWKFRIKELTAEGINALPNEVIHIPYLPEGDWTIELYQVDTDIPLRASFPIRVTNKNATIVGMGVYIALTIISIIGAVIIMLRLRSARHLKNAK